MIHLPSILAQAAPVAVEDTRPWLERVWLKPPASDFAAWSDQLFMFVMWVSIISFVLLMVPMCYWAWRWRRTPGHVQKRTPNHNTMLEITWIVVPLIVVVFMFFWGFHGYIRAFATSSDAEVINVVGKRWVWEATYANGATSQEAVSLDTIDRGDGTIVRAESKSPVIIVPAGRPVKFMLTSTDVIHSFYIPDARLKVDVFPNRTTSYNFTPLANLKDRAENLYLDGKDRPGSDHLIFCAEYCGQNHSEMAAILRILPEDEYQKTLKEWADFEKAYENLDGSRDPKLAADLVALPLWQLGQKIHAIAGCATCHTVTGDQGGLAGPSWKGYYGTNIKFADGSTLGLDTYPGSKDMDEVWDSYIRESIRVPGRRIHEGYANQMAPYTFSDKTLHGIVAYFRHLNGKDAKTATPPSPKN
jgi:cytochrome c oxidase subunit 2